MRDEELHASEAAQTTGIRLYTNTKLCEQGSATSRIQEVHFGASRAQSVLNVCRSGGKDAKAWSDDRAFLAWSENMGAIVIANELRVSLNQCHHGRPSSLPYAFWSTS